MSGAGRRRPHEGIGRTSILVRLRTLHGDLRPGLKVDGPGG